MNESSETVEVIVPVSSVEDVRAAFGTRDELAQLIHQHLEVRMVHRNGQLKLLGHRSDVELVRGLVERVIGNAQRGTLTSAEEFASWVEDIRPAREEFEQSQARDVEVENDSESHKGEKTSSRKKSPSSKEAAADAELGLPKGLSPKSEGQREYLRSIQSHDITFAVGPAGTGKTFLAACCAVSDLKKGRFQRLMLVRPAVEAGEKLGFLPGDFEAKVNPYLRPLFDALYSLLDPRRVQHYADRDVIEVVPLAYMRGRTLDKAFIILDEAQNTTPKQMKMFLTRLGNGSKIVVTGDDTQVDLPPNQESGLADSVSILKGVPGIGMIRLTEKDIVRHPLVQKIVKAYDLAEERGFSRRPSRDMR